MRALPVYLDTNATTPVDPRVLEAMLPWFTERFGNAASGAHRYGWDAAAAVGAARELCALAIGAREEEIVFTSGATESINLALRGLAATRRPERDTIVTGATEHRAVLDTCAALERTGLRLIVLPVDRLGHLDLDGLEAALDSRTLLVSLMGANNEIGTLHDLAAAAERVHAVGAFLHSDLTQCYGRLPLDLPALGVDLASFSAHKLYGPKGIGGLYVRGGQPRIRLAPQQTGGGHERGLRSGTLNVPAIVGMGRAASIALNEMERDNRHTSELRNRLLQLLASSLPDLAVNGPDPRLGAPRLSTNLNVQIPGIPADRLITAARGVAFSTGSACSSESPAPSHVLRAIGLNETEARCSIRLGVGRMTTEGEIERAADLLLAGIAAVRTGS